MKKITLFFLFLLFLGTQESLAQCIPTSARPVTGTVTGSSGTFNFNNMPTGNVVRITAPAVGTFYNISLCSTNGGVPQADGIDDSQLTILNVNSAAATSLGFNDDFCPTTGPNGYGPSELNYTATAAGDIFVYLTEWSAGGANQCIADGANNSYNMVVTITGAAPTCEAGTLTSPTTQIVCPGQTGTIASTGNSTPNNYSVGFTPGATGTGGNTTGFSITGIATLPYTFDDDLNGVLSGQPTPLPPLQGEWILTLYAVDGTGNNCDSTATTSVTFATASNPACGGSGFDAAIVDGFISEYTSVPLTQLTAYTPSCEVLNNGSNAISGISVSTTITATSTNTVVYNTTMTQANLASGVTAPLTAGSSFTPAAIDFYLVEFIVSITQADQVALNDTFRTGIAVEDSLYARDLFLLTGNTASLDGPWFLGAGNSGQLGNVFRAETNTQLVSAIATFGGGFAIGDQTQANLYSMAGATPGALIASSPVLTVTAADTPVIFYEFFFPAGTNLTAGNDYLLTVQQNAASSAGFGLYTATDVYTPNKSFLRVGAGAWEEINVSGIGEQTFMVRAQLYSPPTACAITDVTAGTQTACVSTTNTYTQQVTVTYSNPPVSGMLNVNGQMFAITSSPQTVTLTGLTANGSNVNVTTSFTASPTCTYTENAVFTAPASCAPSCAITDLTAGTQTACVGATNTYTQQVTVTYSTPPASGMLNVNGQMFAITSSPQTVTLTGLTANGSNVNVTATFTASPACTYTENSVFTAPANCTPVCTISDLTAGAQTPCVNTTNNYTQAVVVTYSTPPASGMLNVNGQMFAITSSPQTVTLTSLNSNGLSVNVTATFTASPSCTYTENNLFTAPVGCLCPTINVNVTTTNVTNCSSPNGSATALATGGAGGYSYVWTPSTFGSGPSISGIPSGTYSVVATDVNGCTGTGSGNVTNTSGVNAVVGNVVNASCSVSANGQITINATGGTAPITYTWSDQGFPTSIFSRNNLLAGSYTVIVSDNGGCSVNLGPIVITAPAPLVADLTNQTNVTCNGGSNGSINMTVSGGTQPYDLSWSGTTSSSEDISNLSAGTYQLTVVDDNNCPAVTGPQVTITEPSALVISLVGSTDVSCNGGSNGAANVTVSGGTPPYTYNWGPGNSTTEDLNGASAGTYQLVVTDANLCTQTGPSVSIAEPSVLSLTVSSTDESTSGANDGTATVVASGGTPPYASYLWDDASAQTTATASNLSAGTYNVVVTDANGCSETIGVVVDLGSGIRQIDLNQFQVYPNPATKEVMIAFEGRVARDYEVTIYSVLGKQMFVDQANQAQYYSKTLDVSTFAAGIYLVEVSTAQGKTIKKLTVVK